LTDYREPSSKVGVLGVSSLRPRNYFPLYSGLLSTPSTQSVDSVALDIIGLKQKSVSHGCEVNLLV